MNTSNYKAPISLIKGDVLLSPSESGGEFVEALATNTRLMGVIGIHIKRKRENGFFHQLFYLDMEEYGLDDYQSFFIKDGAPLNELEIAKAQLFGGLGGNPIGITEKEAIYLICLASTFNAKNDLDFPDGEDEYKVILDSPVTLTEEEEALLFHKIAGELPNDYSVINYYIMRSVGQDSMALKHLTVPEGSYDKIPLSEPGTLFRNETEPEDEGKSPVSTFKTYLSTSFIEDDSSFRLLRSRIQVVGSKVYSFNLLSDMVVTPWEAANIMRRNEYTIHLSPFGGNHLPMEELKLEYPEASVNIHNAGVLMMLFREDNSHAAQAVYRLDSDVLISIYFSFSGEILISGYSMARVSSWRDRICDIIYKQEAKEVPEKRFVFPEAVLGKFISGDGDIYEGFLDFIQIFSMDGDD